MEEIQGERNQDMPKVLLLSWAYGRTHNHNWEDQRKDLSENLLVTVEKAEAALQSESKYEKREPGNLYGCPSRPFPVHICSC